MTHDLLNEPVIAQRYFFPRPNAAPNPFMVDCGDAALACCYARPWPNALTVIHFHGNGETAADYLGPYLDAVTALGVNCLLAEYRGYGGSTGEPALGKMLDDVARIVEATGQPPERIAMFGRSVGSIFAIHGASLYPELAGLIVESGVADVLERLLMRVHPDELPGGAPALRAAVSARLDHRAKLSGYRGPFLAMHARGDSLVDVSHAERAHAWAAGPKSLRIFERGDHNTIISANQPAYFETIGEFLAGLARA